MYYFGIFIGNLCRQDIRSMHWICHLCAVCGWHCIFSTIFFPFPSIFQGRCGSLLFSSHSTCPCVFCSIFGHFPAEVFFCIRLSRFFGCVCWVWTIFHISHIFFYWTSYYFNPRKKKELEKIIMPITNHIVHHIQYVPHECKGAFSGEERLVIIFSPCLFTPYITTFKKKA